MSLPGLGEEVTCHGNIIGVVQNEQPSVVCVQPVLDRLNDHALVLGLMLWQSQKSGEGDVL